MNRKISKILLLSIIGFMLFLPRVYADSPASVTLNKTEVKPGDTVEMYIDLKTESSAYDLKIDIDDKTLIKESEMETNTGNGNLDRIYLVQVLPADQRILYPVDTRIATYTYTVADDITENKEIKISVKGDIAGATSSDKNSLDTSVTINVKVDSNSNPVIPTTPGTVNNTITPSNNVIVDNKTPTPSNNVPTNTVDNTNRKLNIAKFDANVKAEQKAVDNTISKEKLPATGKINIVKLIIGIVVLQVFVIIKIKKLK